jgi:O-methyltransferase
LERWNLDLNMYEFVVGWFENTIPLNNINKISLLRLDGDLYSSTKVCLDNLHHKVQKGGYVIVDDYALAGARKAVHEYFENNKLNYELIPVNPLIKEVHWYQVI